MLTWIFDLDNTLHDATPHIMPHINRSMTEYVQRQLAVGGARNSQHAQGFAADFTCPGFGPPLAIARAVRDSTIVFDTVILEFDEWIHVSFTATPRRRVLTIYDAKEGYLDGLLDTGRRPVP